MKNLLFLLLFSSIALSVQAEAPNWGVPDTLAHHPVGPGIQFTNIRFKGAGMLVWITEVDLSNPHNKVEQVQSRHQVPDVLRWTVQEHYKQNTYENHRVCVAFNHDFFSYEAGACIGINVSEGEIAYGGGWGRSLLAITEDKKAFVFKPNLDANVILPDGTKIRIDCFNSQALGLAGDCILFNRMNARTLGEAGKYIKVSPQAKWTVNGEDIPCEVLEISNNPLQTSAEEYVVYLRGEKQTAVDGKLQAGDVLHVSQKMIAGTDAFNIAPANIVNAFHGYPSIAFEGKLHDGEYNNFENGREYEISSRQMAGMSQDGKTLYIVTTEMSRTSMGVDCVDVANYMLAHGSWNVVNFDSGGSTAIVVDSEMLNYPARDAVRPVEDAMLIVAVVEESATINSYRFLVPGFSTSVASTKNLTLLAFNEHDEVLSKKVEGFTFRCEPEALGWVDEQQVFHAGIHAGTGVIVAEKDGKQARVRVEVKSADQINITPDKILIDRIRTYPIGVKSVIGKDQFTIDPGVLEWSVENGSVCEVEDGILKGFENGTTKVTGIFDGKEKDLEVTVEAGEGILLAESMDDPATFKLKTVGTKNFSFASEGLPAGWTHGTVMDFTFTFERGPYIELTKDLIFYGLPDSISLMLKNDDGIVSAVEFYLENASKEKLTQKLSLQSDGEQLIVVPFKDADGLWGVSNFPISLKKVRFILDAEEEGGKYAVPVGNLRAYYPEGMTKVIDIPANNPFQVYVSASALHVDYDLSEPGDVAFTLYSVDGKAVCSASKQNVSAGTYRESMGIASLSQGIYILHVRINGVGYSHKIMK